jgi:hypothetical protein
MVGRRSSVEGTRYGIGVRLAWCIWLVCCCLFELLAIFAPKSRAGTPLAVTVILGVLTFAVWLTDGRLAFFTVGAFPVALLLLWTATVSATPNAHFSLASFVAAVPHLLKLALVFAALLAVGIEVGGRFSGSAFVVWRACLGGGVVLIGGLALMRRVVRSVASEG